MAAQEAGPTGSVWAVGFTDADAAGLVSSANQNLYVIGLFQAAPVFANAQTIGVPGLTNFRYKKRGRDQGAPGPNPFYVTWVTQDPAGPYPFVPPFGGPIVEETLVERWPVTEIG